MGLPRKKKNTWTNEEIEFLKNNYLNISYGEIGKIIGRSAECVNQKIMHLGLQKKFENYWTDEEVEYLKEKYPKYMTLKEVAQNLKRSHKSVSTKNEVIGNQAYNDEVKRGRIYRFKEDFFETPNINNSYWAGWFLGDSSICDSNIYGGKKRNATVDLKIKSTDKSILDKFKQEIDGNFKIHSLRRFDKRTNKYYESVWFKITSSKICEDLRSNFNITSQKSKFYVFPDHLSFDNKAALLVGLIESDGWISLDKKKNLIFGICCSTEEMGKAIQKFFSNIMANDKRNGCLRQQGKIWKITYCGNRLVPKLLKPLYDLTVFNLERKWEKLKEFYE